MVEAHTCAEDDDAVVSPTPRGIVSHLGPQVLRGIRVAAYLCVELADMVVKNDIRRGSLILVCGLSPL